MNLSNVEEDDPYQIFNSCASTTTESVGSFIKNILCPPESVYYAAEYIRLQSEIDNLKENVKNLETQLRRKETENGQIQISKETEVQLQEKYNLERMKTVDFYETGIKLLRQQNRDLERRNNEQSKNIDSLSEQLRLANLNIEKQTDENCILKDSLSQVLSQEHEETAIHTKEFCKTREVKKGNPFTRKKTNVFSRKRKTIQQNDSTNLNDNSTETSQTLTNVEQNNEEQCSLYQPISSPVTPVEVVDQERISVITHRNNVTTTSELQTISTSIPSSSSSSLEVGEHYEVSVTLSHELEKHLYMCACGKKFDTIGKLRTHICQMKNGKVFNCRICKVGFLLHPNLKVHYKRRHGIEYQYGRYGCGYCGRTFSSSKLLRRHKIFEHWNIGQGTMRESNSATVQ